jgi:chromosome segregation ATPase
LSRRRGAAHALAKAGSLLRILLTNVRNHEKLEVTFNHAVNFISGLNGSGKSSILMGIKLGLGWTPSHTADKSISIIATKCVSGKAMVELDIVNRKDASGWSCRGSTIYNEEFYNRGHKRDHIPVIRVRRFMTRPMEEVGKAEKSLSFSSEFRIYDAADDKEIAKGARGRALLKEITTALNLDYTNPVIVMDQELSKKILLTKPVELYNYFMQSTGLTDDFNYIMTQSEQAKITKEKQEENKVVLKKKEADMKQTEKTFIKVKGLAAMDAQMKAASAERVWATFAESDKELAKLRAGLKDEADKYKKLIGTRDGGLTKQQKMAADTVELAEQAVAAGEDLCRDQAEKVEAIVEKLKQASAPIAVANAAKLKAEKEAAKFRSEAAKKSKDLAALEEARRVRVSQSKSAAKARALDAANAKLAAALKDVPKAQAEVERAGVVFEQAKQENSQRVSAEKSAREQVQQLESEIEAAKGSDDKDGIALFRRSAGPPVKGAVRILELIERHKAEFTKVPLGPLGAYVRVKDQAYVRAFESKCHLVMSFLCDNQKDHQLLDRLCAAEKLTNVLNVLRRAEPKSFDPKRYARPEGLPVLADILEFDNAWAAYAIFEDTSANDTVLARNYEHAESLVAVRNAKGKPCGMKKGVKCVITTELKKIEIREFSIIDQTMGGRSDGLPLVRGPSSEAAVQDAKARLASARETHKAAVAALSAYREVVTTAERDCAEQNRTLKQLNDKKAAAKRQKDEANAMPDDEDVDDSAEQSKKAELEASISDMEASAEAELKKAADAAARAEVLQPSVSKLDDELEKMNAQATKSSESLTDAKARLRDANKELDKVKLAQVKLNVMIDASHAAKQKLEADADVKAAAVEEVRKAARAATGRDEPDPANADWCRSEREADAHIKALSAEFERAKKKHGDIDLTQIMDAYAKATAEFMEQKEKVGNVEILLDGYQTFKKKAIAGFYECRAKAVEEVTAKFVDRMTSRGHHAVLTFRHGGTGRDSDPDLSEMNNGEGLIEMEVDFDFNQRGTGGKKAAADAPKKTVKSFSGGEKSYTGSVLLGAIATVASPPFRLVDEFDVYLDETKRAGILREVIKDAKSEKDEFGCYTQFIGITPHDISAVAKEVGPEMAIHMLKAPREAPH